MIALIDWQAGTKPVRQAVHIQLRSIRTLTLTQVQIRKGAHTPVRLLRHRIRTAARELQRRGVTRAVFGREFSMAGEFARWGILPVETQALWQALAAPLTAAAAAQAELSAGRAVVAVCGERLSAAMVRTVTELCMRWRYVRLCVPSGGEELCRTLRREYGAALVLEHGREQTPQADLYVCFDSPPDAVRKGGIVLDLSGAGAEEGRPGLYFPPDLEAQLPQEGDRAQLAAALLEGGALRRSEIGIAGKPAET